MRGLGLICGVQLDVPAGPLVGAARERGLLVITAGKGDIVRLVPPLIVRCGGVARGAASIVPASAQAAGRPRVLPAAGVAGRPLLQCNLTRPALPLAPPPPAPCCSEEEIERCCQVLGEVAKEVLA